MSYDRKRKEKAIYEKKAKQMRKGYINTGYYYNEELERTVRINHASGNAKFVSRQSNKKIRKANTEIPDGQAFSKVYENGLCDW